jgi:hypothetical protein
MSELNHELDRDNLNKPSPADGADKPLGGLSFPSESDRYERHPSPPVRTLGMYFEKIS